MSVKCTKVLEINNNRTLESEIFPDQRPTRQVPQTVLSLSITFG